MINAQVSSVADRKATPEVRRIGPRVFWMLFAFIGLCVAGMFILALPMILPVRAPLAQTRDYATVRAAIQARLNGSVNDPLVEVAPGVTARLSNVGGFTLNGYTYYYYREGQPGFDPVSRGVIARDQVELVAHDEIGSAAVVIYRVPSKDRATN